MVRAEGIAYSSHAMFSSLLAPLRKQPVLLLCNKFLSSRKNFNTFLKFHTAVWFSKFYHSPKPCVWWPAGMPDQGGRD